MFDESMVTAGDLMTRDVAAVRPDTPLKDAVTLMARRHVSGLPVVSETGAVIGMVTEGDLVRWHEGYTAKQARWLDMLADGFSLAPNFLEGVLSEQNRVRAVMSHGVTAVAEDTPARQIAALMHEKDIKRVPVLRDGKLVGIVARSDLVRALATRMAQDAAKPPSAPPAGSLNEALRRRREEH